MIIDAMDILYADKVDGFVLVSSDSDFTRLATRLREAGKIVYGLGEMKTPNAFIAACDRFIYLEIIGQDEDDSDNDVKEDKSATRSPLRSTRLTRGTSQNDNAGSKASGKTNDITRGKRETRIESGIRKSIAI